MVKLADPNESLPSRYANRAGSRFQFLLLWEGQSPKGDTPPDAVLQLGADPKLRIAGSDFAGTLFNALAIAHLAEEEENGF